uniref:Wax2_C domain-containing protein n=1 Tax=Rhabditophanes sp. KR3021 TaxID=114890 RepID=A0AC35TXM6_9BILA
MFGNIVSTIIAKKLNKSHTRIFLASGNSNIKTSVEFLDDYGIKPVQRNIPKIIISEADDIKLAPNFDDLVFSTDMDKPLLIYSKFQYDHIHQGHQ